MRALFWFVLGAAAMAAFVYRDRILFLIRNREKLEAGAEFVDDLGKVVDSGRRAWEEIRGRSAEAEGN